MPSQNDLASRVLRTISRRRMMRAGDRAGVAVSGGADSVALLRLLLELEDGLGIRLAVLHFNHQLRGAESDADEEFVADLAARHGLEFVAGRNDVAAVAQARGWNLEDAGRRLRYGFFSSAAANAGLNCVAVAHTADDQAETVLARLERGTGPAGLAAIYPVKELPSTEQEAAADRSSAPRRIVRPLLEIRRGELREFLRRSGQSWREDASNQDTSRLRARLRHEILPLLEDRLQPGIVGHLNRLAQLAREDETFWTALVAERMSALVRRERRRVGIRCADLLAPLPLLPGGGMAGQETASMALTRRLVRALAGELGGKCARLTSQHVAQVVHLAEARQTGRVTELPGLVVERSFEWLWFLPAEDFASRRSAAEISEFSNFEASGAEFSYSVDLRPPGESTVIAVPEINKCFRLKVIDWPPVERDTSYTKGLLDRDLLGAPLVLRSWRPGDAFRPFGRSGVRKLKRFLQVRRVASRDRVGWPVLTSAGALVWARDLPVAAAFAAGKTTRCGVVVVEEEL